MEFTADQQSQMWPQAAQELTGFAKVLEQKSGLTAAQLRMAIQMADAYLSLREAVWPGKPKWEPTTAEPQQDFFEAFAESLHHPEFYMLRPASEYHEDYSCVLWWHLPICEPPVVDSTIEENERFKDGWFTHWSPLPDCKRLVASDGAEIS